MGDFVTPDAACQQKIRQWRVIVEVMVFRDQYVGPGQGPSHQCQSAMSTVVRYYQIHRVKQGMTQTGALTFPQHHAFPECRH